MKRGLVHLYTGDGKGKTTAALGLSVRFAGWGGRVLFLQFLKKGHWGEIRALSSFPGVEIRQLGQGGFVRPDDPDSLSSARQAFEAGLEMLNREMASGSWGMMVADEIVLGVPMKLVRTEELLSLIQSKPQELELVLTGRGAPRSLVDACDLVTEMREIKHPFQKGVKARRGIEF